MARVGVPVIDMQKVEGLEEEIVKAFEEWGCFRMVNHGVPPQLMAEMKTVVASLFDLPEEIQSRDTYTKHGMGYTRQGLTNPFHESFGIGNISSSDDFCDSLDVSTHQRKTIYKYINAIRDLAQLLGRKLMKGNGLVGDLFDGWCCELRMNKYHFCDESIGLLGSDLHSDPSFLTIVQDDENVNGLQVVDKYSGEFVPLDHIPGSLVVNIGDIGKTNVISKPIGKLDSFVVRTPTFRASFATIFCTNVDEHVTDTSGQKIVEPVFILHMSPV